MTMLINPFRLGVIAGGGGGVSIIGGSVSAFYNSYSGATATNLGSYAVPAGDNKMLVVLANGSRPNNSNQHISGITHNGVAMTEVTGFRSGDRNAGSRRQQMFVLPLGSTTPTGDIVATAALYHQSQFHAFIVGDTNQTIGAIIAATSGTTISSNTDVTGIAVGSLVVDSIIILGDAAAITETENPLFEVGRVEDANTSPAFRTGGSFATAGASSKTMAWTVSGATPYFHSAAAFAPA